MFIYARQDKLSHLAFNIKKCQVITNFRKNQDMSFDYSFNANHAIIKTINQEFALDSDC